MTPLSFLVLTDHRGHSDQNSLYALVNTLRQDARCRYVDVASRGNPQNAEFFNAAGSQVQGCRVKGGFVYQPEGGQFTRNNIPLDVGGYDVVWLRLPHPVPQSFLDGLVGGETQDVASLPGRLVVNDPVGIVETGDKSFLTRFPEWTPPVRLVHTADDIRDFARRHPLVLKPLRAYGGQGIVRVDGPNDLPSDLDLTEPYLAMKFLKNVSEGDKRILVVNGRILAASLRLPAPGQWLCNVAQGGTSIGADIEPEEHAMIEAIAPELLRRGICFCGVDTLLNDAGKRVLSELNTLSIGGFPQAETQSGRPVVQQAIDELFNYCYDHL